MEIVLVNDGSPDNSLAVRPCAVSEKRGGINGGQSRRKLWRTQRGDGVGAHARGAYIINMDDDLQTHRKKC